MALECRDHGDKEPQSDKVEGFDVDQNQLTQMIKLEEATVKDVHKALASG